MTSIFSLQFIVYSLQTFDEGLGNLEGLLSSGVPEVVVLRGVGVAQGHVADDAEGDKRHLEDIAGLGDGGTLHVDGLRLREVADDLTHLLLRVDEPVTGDNQARVDLDVSQLFVQG